MTLPFDETYLQTAVDTLDYAECTATINAAKPNRLPITNEECRLIARAIQTWLIQAAKQQGRNFQNYAFELLDAIGEEQAGPEEKTQLSSRSLSGASDQRSSPSAR